MAKGCLPLLAALLIGLVENAGAMLVMNVTLDYDQDRAYGAAQCRSGR